MDEVEAGTPNVADEQDGDSRIGRRDALKKAAVGAGVAGIVWSAPKIADLSLAPDFAAAASGGCSGTFTIDVPLPGDRDSTDPSTPLDSDFTTNKTCGKLVFHIDSKYDGSLTDGLTRHVTISKNNAASDSNCNVTTGNAHRTYDGVQVRDIDSNADVQPTTTDANDPDITRAAFNTNDDDTDNYAGQGGKAHLGITC
jgi:hypothetical protein